MLALASSKLPGGQARLRKMLGERVKGITIKAFMDLATMTEERLTQCRVHVATKGDDDADQCAPFCAVQAWPKLAGQRLAWAAQEGRALPVRAIEIGQPS